MAEQNDTTMQVLESIQEGRIAKFIKTVNDGTAVVGADLGNKLGFELAQLQNAMLHHLRLFAMAHCLADALNGLLAHTEQLDAGSYREAIDAARSAREAWAKFQSAESVK